MSGFYIFQIIYNKQHFTRSRHVHDVTTFIALPDSKTYYYRKWYWKLRNISTIQTQLCNVKYNHVHVNQLWLLTLFLNCDKSNLNRLNVLLSLFMSLPITAVCSGLWRNEVTNNDQDRLYASHFCHVERNVCDTATKCLSCYGNILSYVRWHVNYTV